MNGVMKTIIERRSVRQFDTEKAVAESALVEIVKAGAYAPSAMNRQAWHFTVVQNKELLSRLNDKIKALASKEQEERIRARATDNEYCFFYRAPVLIIVSMSENALFPREDAACAMQNMMIASTALGIGSCWINQLGNGASEDEGVRAVLDECGVPKGNKVYAALAVGYALKSSPMPDRAHGAVNFVK